MTNLLNAVKQTKTPRTRSSYSLDEILFIMKLLSEERSLEEVSNLTGRSKNTLRYKFLEGEVVINGNSVVRSVKKYKDMQELFADHKTEFKGAEDIKTRIENYQAKLAQAQQAV